MGEPRAIVLDACVLYARIPRRIVLGVAERGLIAPLWSARILDEWRIAAHRKGGDIAEIRRATGAMQIRWPDACLPPSPEREAAIALPDPNDAHVLAITVGEAPQILTFNLRDFPRHVLAGHGVEAIHPDGFLWLLFSEHPEEVGAVIADMAADDDARTAQEQRRLLKRARLPRLGKAVEAARSGPAYSSKA
ncbi:MAG: PIN domain-containing protein [Pseudomonadota bacterium]